MNIQDFASMLDPDELALAVHLHISNRPLVDAAMALGWTTHRAKRTYERLRLKIKRAAAQNDSPPRTMDETPPRNSIPQYRERLESGRRVWAMRPTSDMYLDMVVNALPVGEFSHVHENNHSLDIKQRVGRRINAMEVVTVNLEKNLTDAKTNLARIQREREGQQGRLNLVSAKIATAESEAKKEAENDVLAGRAPGAKRGAELTKLRTEAREIEESLEVYTRAIERAQANIDAIAGEIQIKHLEINRAKFEPTAVKIYAAFDVLMNAVAEVSKVVSETGPVDLRAVLFPLDNPAAADIYSMETLRAYMSAYNAGAKLLRLRQADLLKKYDRRAA